jgi:hypothetical protein
MKHKRSILVFIILSFYFTGSSQTLNLPVRQLTARSGSQFVDYITSMNLTDRENAIYAEFLSGNVPSFMRNMISVNSTATISSVVYTATYYVISDYAAIGCDTDYFLCPMTPLLAQRIADQIGCTLPTRKMVNDIWTAATVKLEPSTISPSAQMVTVPIFATHDSTVWVQRSAVLAAHPLGELVGGDKKDVIISNHIYGNPSPGRVVIYGWHHTNGTAIQPLYYGHEETYADYSHGIRFVQLACTLNGNASNVNDILESSTLNTVLSDEGSIAVPRYPVDPPQAVTPSSFCVLRDSTHSLRVIISGAAENSRYAVQLSNDGLTFGASQYFNDTTFLLTNLVSDSVCFIRVAGMNSFDTSAWSEVLAATPSIFNERVLIVNGYDRPTTGNTFNFIRQHGKAILKSGYLFSSATNEALINGLVSLPAYSIADLILGDESTANETFSAAEQALFAAFLDQGGKLLVSGSEIAWDLDYKGSASDKSFYNNYLKAQYVNDAPNGQSSTYYSSSPVSTQFFKDVSPFSFDNGTHGTFNVAYPDVINGINGGTNCFYYTGLSTNYAGVCYTGVFPSSGTKEGKLVNMGMPFETIYPDTSRHNIMSKVMEYFEPSPDVTLTADGPLSICMGDSVTLSAVNDFACSYQWVCNGSNIPNADSFYYTVHQSGLYAVIITHNGKSALSVAVTVAVNPLPFAYAGNDTIVCSGDAVTLSASGGTTYAWNNGVIQGTPFYPSASAVYQVTVTDGNGCSATDEVAVDIDFPSIPLITQIGDTLRSSPADSYQWYDSTGAISGGTLQTLHPLHNGEYYVITNDTAGCKEQSPSFYYLATGIASVMQADDIIFSYDPGAEQISLTSRSVSLEGVSASLCDVSGRSMIRSASKTGGEHSMTMALSGLSPGIYIFHLRTKENLFSRKIFIK